MAVGGAAVRGDQAMENVDKMLHAAQYGREVLDAAAQRAAAEAARAAAAVEHPVEEVEGSAGKGRPASTTVRSRVLCGIRSSGLPPLVSHQRPDQPAEGGQTCLGCNATSTPEWRRGPMGVYIPLLCFLDVLTLCQVLAHCATPADWSTRSWYIFAPLPPPSVVSPLYLQVKKRTREPGRSRGGGQAAHGGQANPDAFSSGEDGSDNDSNGSPDRRSDPGDAARR